VFRTMGAAALSLVVVAAAGVIAGTGAVLARGVDSPPAAEVASAPGAETSGHFVDFWVTNNSSKSFELTDKDGDLSERLSPPAGRLLYPGTRHTFVMIRTSPSTDAWGSAWYQDLSRPGSIEVRMTSDSTGDEILGASAALGVKVETRGRELFLSDVT
jgi:hypothetical protein